MFRDVIETVDQTDQLLKGTRTHQNVKILIETHRLLDRFQPLLHLLFAGINFRLILVNIGLQRLDLLLLDCDLTIEIRDVVVERRGLFLIVLSLGRIGFNILGSLGDVIFQLAHLILQRRGALRLILQKFAARRLVVRRKVAAAGA